MFKFSTLSRANIILLWPHLPLTNNIRIIDYFLKVANVSDHFLQAWHSDTLPGNINDFYSSNYYLRK